MNIEISWEHQPFPSVESDARDIAAGVVWFGSPEGERNFALGLIDALRRSPPYWEGKRRECEELIALLSAHLDQLHEESY